MFESLVAHAEPSTSQPLLAPFSGCQGEAQQSGCCSALGNLSIVAPVTRCASSSLAIDDGPTASISSSRARTVLCGSPISSPRRVH